MHFGFDAGTVGYPARIVATPILRTCPRPIGKGEALTVYDILELLARPSLIWRMPLENQRLGRARSARSPSYDGPTRHLFLRGSLRIMNRAEQSDAIAIRQKGSIDPEALFASFLCSSEACGCEMTTEAK